jgi:hypothetical protein
LLVLAHLARRLPQPRALRSLLLPTTPTRTARVFATASSVARRVRFDPVRLRADQTCDARVTL